MKASFFFRWMSIRTVILLATWAATTLHCQSQVTSVTNGLVAFYPLDNLTPGNPGTTPDIINRRDLNLSPAFSITNIIPSTHPGGIVSNCFNLNQVGGATVLYYASAGQNPLDGSGDFLPFCNQRTATMN